MILERAPLGKSVIVLLASFLTGPADVARPHHCRSVAPYCQVSGIGTGIPNKGSEASEAARNPSRGGKSPRCLRAKPCRAGWGDTPGHPRKARTRRGSPKGFAGKQRGASSSARAGGPLLMSESQHRNPSAAVSFICGIDGDAGPEGCEGAGEAGQTAIPEFEIPTRARTAARSGLLSESQRGSGAPTWQEELLPPGKPSYGSMQQQMPAASSAA